MLKRIKGLVLILTLLVMADFLAGCREETVTPPVSSFKPLNVMQIAEIELAWPHSPLGAYPCPDLSSDQVYYGTHGDYIAIFEHGVLCMEQTRTIAGVEISYGHPFYIYLYKDGRFIEIEDAYNDGLVHKETIEAIAEYHKKPRYNSNNPIFEGMLHSITEVTVINQHTNEVVFQTDDPDTIKRIRNTFIGWSYESAATEKCDTDFVYMITFEALHGMVQIEFSDSSICCAIDHKHYLLPEAFRQQIVEYIEKS